MKRTLVLAATFALLLTGCGPKPAEPGTAPAPNPPPTSATTPGGTAGTEPGSQTPGGTTGSTSGQPPTDSRPTPAEGDDIVWQQKKIGYPLVSDDPRAEGQKVVMLTFDDGPATEAQKGATGQILDILKRENIKALFFVTGYGVKNLDLLQREIDEGHIIGTHTLTHPRLWELTSKEEVEKEILTVNREVEKYTGKPVKYFRPPNGMYNDLIKQVLREDNVELINWTTGALDWQLRDPQKIADQVLKTVVPGGIVLLHDTHTWTAEALPLIIQGLRDKGYEFVTLP